VWVGAKTVKHTKSFGNEGCLQFLIYNGVLYRTRVYDEPPYFYWLFVPLKKNHTKHMLLTK